MTRETKLGLIVAGSFLALVGGVMGVKSFLHPANPATGTDVKAIADAQPPAIPTPETKPASSTPAEKHQPVITPNGDEEPIKTSPVPKLAAQPDNQREVPFRSTTRPMSDPEVTPAAGRAGAPLVLDEVPVPVISETPVKKVEAPLILDEVPVPKTVELHVKKDTSPKSDTLELPPLMPIDEKKKEATSLEKVELPPLKSDPALMPIDEKKKEATPHEKVELPPLKSDPAPDPLKLVQLPQEQVPVPTAAELKKETKPTLEPAAIDPPPAARTPQEVTPMPKTKQDPLALETPPSTMGSITLQPAKKQDNREPTAPAQPAKIEFTIPKKNDVPPLELRPTDPPPARDPAPAIAAKPSEDNYEEDLYTMRNGDTYSTISKLHYRSETYSTALYKYNQANRSTQADYIRIPPVWILEKRYPNDINNGAQTTNSAPPVAIDANRSSENVYIVPTNGEFLAEIAQKTLGNEDAWTRIKELNKSINEVKRIPAGTRLVLPTEAKVNGN